MCIKTVIRALYNFYNIDAMIPFYRTHTCYCGYLQFSGAVFGCMDAQLFLPVTDKERK